MNKKLGLVLILILALSLVSVSAQVDVGYEEVNRGSIMRFYNEGYDQLLRPDGSILVDRQTYTVEYLDGENWKKVSTPYGLTKDSEKITRHESKDSTYVNVVYDVTTSKTDVVIESGESRIYRIVWELSGIDNTDYRIVDNGVLFNSQDDWVLADWSDAEGVGTTFEASPHGLKVIFNVGFIGEGERYILDPTLIDSYTTAPNTYPLKANHPSAGITISSTSMGFTATQTIKLVEAQFELKEILAPTGNAVARLYAMTGVLGTNGKPTGAALATSQNVDISTVGAAFTWVSFIFTDEYEMQAGQNYCIAYENPAAGIDAANHIAVQNVGAATGGIMGFYSSGVWSTFGDFSFNFKVLGGPFVENTQLDSTPVFSKDIPNWVNVTVFDALGVADLNTVTIQVNTTGDSENFTLRWTQAGDTFTEVSDPSNICTLNASSVRTNINATYDLISFNFAITGGQSGLCDVRVTTLNDGVLSDVDLYNNEFTFSYYNWNPTADLIDSAFEQFGIIGYLTSITTWIDGLVSKFESSLTRVLALVLLQFTVIEEVYGFFTGWATSILAIALTFSTFWQSIMDGTSPWIQPIYAIGNFWDLIGYDSWAPAVPALLFIWWLDSMPKRAAQTVGGELQVFINDLNTAIGLISYFVSIFSYVANTIIDRIYGLFPAIT